VRRNSDEGLRALEREVELGNPAALVPYDRAFVRAYGLNELALRYARMLLIAYRATPEGQIASICVPDGVSDRAAGIELTAKHGVETRRRAVLRPDGGRTGSFAEEAQGYVAIKSVLLPGLPEEFYQPRVPERSDALRDGPPGVPVRRSSAADAGVEVDAGEQNLIRDEDDNLEWVLGWGDREFVLEAARGFVATRTMVAQIEARRSERRAAGLDAWENVQRELQALATEISESKTGRDVSHLWSRAVELLRGVEPPAIRGSDTRPVNAAGEGWSRWATQRLAKLLSETPFDDGRRSYRLLVTANPCSLWSSENGSLGLSNLEVLPAGTARSWQGENRERLRVSIAYPIAMDFVAMVRKARRKRADEWHKLYPVTGRFELATNWDSGTRTGRLADLVESVIRKNFPKAIIERTTRRP